MSRRLPPLNALRAFEATARHLSVKNAADELCVTPGAISQMLKTLEQQLGVKLLLVPRLKSFQEANPEIDLQVITSKALVDFSRESVDVAVRHGLGRYPGLHSERIFAVELVPVAAPALAARLGTPTSPNELTRWPHVHDAERKDWHLWFQAQGIDEIDPPRGPAFGDASLQLQAVLEGQGAGLLPAAIAALDLAEGRLEWILGAAASDAPGRR